MGRVINNSYWAAITFRGMHSRVEGSILLAHKACSIFNSIYSTPSSSSISTAKSPYHTHLCSSTPLQPKCIVHRYQTACSNTVEFASPSSPVSHTLFSSPSVRASDASFLLRCFSFCLQCFLGASMSTEKCYQVTFIEEKMEIMNAILNCFSEKHKRGKK